jgi:hypothetical protein
MVDLKKEHPYLPVLFREANKKKVAPAIDYLMKIPYIMIFAHMMLSLRLLKGKRGFKARGWKSRQSRYNAATKSIQNRYRIATKPLQFRYGF